MSISKYIITNKKIKKEDVIALLHQLSSDLSDLDAQKNKVIIWAKDKHKLTFLEIAHALGYNSKSNIHRRYYEAKGGKS